MLLKRFLIVLFLGLSLSTWALDVPPLRQPVTDLAKIIDQNSLYTLNSVLYRLHQQKIAQIAVLTIPSLEGESLEGYSIKVVDQWQLGGKEKDRGLLFLVSKKERKVRIEVGQGLEGKMTDLTSKRIVDQMTPYFKQGQVGEGLKMGLAKTLQVLDVKSGDLGTRKVKSRRRKRRASWPSLIFIIIIIFLFRKNPLLLLYILSGSSRRGGGGGFGGGGGGGFGGGGGGFSGGGASGDW